ncbi:hypothetical protein [Parasedimentitalea huanghaiensis]|uniref:Uncharacterized protein n=1 Tax=Parasedimentitalea huanghaiensis TaxID=2682100 RepID=A0A6L6WD39_9RHOB|nr:hypothetical protein [Zongyanglinia huanghaiensis]MVO14809.1 hypothetical protein [Zongyanglinia huanghaiensis]
MSDILAKLRDAHNSRKMVKVHVSEYGIDLHFPPLTLADHEAIRQGVNPSDEHALMVSGMVHQAKNADGSPAFPNEPEVKAELHKMEFAVMSRIMGEASGGVGETAQQELAALDLDVLKKALKQVVAGSPVLSKAVDAASPGFLLYTLERIVSAHEAKQPIKNG